MTDVTRWTPVGLLAAPSHVWGMATSPNAPNLCPVDRSTDRLAIVDVGWGLPLNHHAGVFDNYDSIKSRIRAAASSSAQCVLMSVDSEGGLVDGCIDTVLEIREIMRASGKKLYGYIDSKAASAAYALITACDYVFIPPTGLAGSIGVYRQRDDVTLVDAAMGVKANIIAAGDRKTDSNPHVEFTPEARAAMQREIDAVNGVFCETVAQFRGLTPERVKSYQAGVFIGQAAIDAGLADQIATEDQVIALLSSGNFEAKASQTTQGKGAKMAGFAEAMAAIQAIVDDENESPENKEKARKMIHACNTAPKAENDGDADDKKDAPPADHKEPDGDEAKKALLKASNAEEIARAALLASRPDFTKAERDTLLKADINTVRDACLTWERRNPVVAPVAGARAALGVQSDKQTPAPAAPPAPASNNLPDYGKHGAALLARLGNEGHEAPYDDEEGFHCVPVLGPQAQRDFVAAARRRATPPDAR